jgi:hypothetical protein
MTDPLPPQQQQHQMQPKQSLNSDFRKTVAFVINKLTRTLKNQTLVTVRSVNKLAIFSDVVLSPKDTINCTL